MERKKPVLFILIFSAVILLFFLLMQPYEIKIGGHAISVLFPEGSIGAKQRNLLLFIQVLMLIVVIPVYILTFLFSWKYRAQNTKAKYDPDKAHYRFVEPICWGIPCILILIIGISTWIKTYQLDPYRPITSENKTVTIQAVALQWKWLFIYPEEKIATVNYVRFPVKTPIHFEITADAPMNSFWIPQLGGQIYAMPKMRTKLYLIADEVGDFRGSSANLSGEGFAGMHFVATATSNEEFHKWVDEAKTSPKNLNLEEYKTVASPSSDEPPSTYQLGTENLFEAIIMKYTHPLGPSKNNFIILDCTKAPGVERSQTGAVLTQYDPVCDRSTAGLSRSLRLRSYSWTGPLQQAEH